MDIKYLEPTQESGARLFSKNIQGEVTMLNLLKFRKIADYSENPELDTGDQISGEHAYQKHMDQTLPYLKESGGKIVFEGRCDRYLIGPEYEEWDYMLLIQQSSLQSFLAFASNSAYLKVLGHRTAALEDSRLLPIFDKQI
jgi:hypothetical protein